MVLAIFGSVVGESHALIITEFSPLSGPGLGAIGVPLVQTPVTTPFPNNDNAAPSPNRIAFSAPFGAVAPIDVVFSVAESGGATEYFFRESVTNFTGVAWNEYHVELGLGLGDSFTPFRRIAFVRPTIVPDFDTPDRDPRPLSAVFTPLDHQDDAIRWAHGIVPAGGSVDVTFSIDVADDPLGSLGPFTLRQVPTAIPEPGTLTLFGIGLLSLLGYGWRRRPHAA